MKNVDFKFLLTKMETMYSAAESIQDMKQYNVYTVARELIRMIEDKNKPVSNKKTFKLIKS